LRWMVIPNYHATNTGHHLLNPVFATAPLKNQIMCP
jgi:hypothetical protein